MITFSLMRVTNYEQLIDHPETALKKKEKETERKRERSYLETWFISIVNKIYCYNVHSLQYFPF